MIDEQKLNGLVELVEQGINLETACSQLRISSRTIYSFIERGKIEEARLADNPRLKPKKSEEGCLELWLDLRQADAFFVGTMERLMFQAAKDGEYKATIWVLENRAPRSYGKKAAMPQPKQVEEAAYYEIEEA